MANKIAITGMGSISFAGNNSEESFKALFSTQEKNITSPKLFATTTDKYPAFELANLKINTKNIYRNEFFALESLKEAMDTADIDLDYIKNKKVGVCIGTTVGVTLNNEDFYRNYKKGINTDKKPLNHFFYSNPAIKIAKYLNSKNAPVQCIANACSSGTDAIGLASLWIQAGLCDIAIAGGTDELSKITYLGFISLMITSEKKCTPFDKNRSGLNLGEGAGIVILESSKNMKERNKKPISYISSYASFTDAYHHIAPDPNGTGLRKAVIKALKNSEISEKDIAFINAHGTGTKLNDKTESFVINEIFGNSVPFFSTKALTGHTLGGAGAIEAIFSIKSLCYQKIPKSLGFKTFDQEMSIMPNIETRNIDKKFAISQSLAFGGNNSVLIFSM